MLSTFVCFVVKYNLLYSCLLQHNSLAFLCPLFWSSRSTLHVLRERRGRRRHVLISYIMLQVIAHFIFISEMTSSRTILPQSFSNNHNCHLSHNQDNNFDFLISSTKFLYLLLCRWPLMSHKRDSRTAFRCGNISTVTKLIPFPAYIM